MQIIPVTPAFTTWIHTSYSAGRTSIKNNLDEPDPECDLDYVPDHARERQVRSAFCNRIGFGSKNSSLVIEKLSR